MKQLTVLLFLLFSIKLLAQTEDNPEKKYKYAIGVLGNHKSIGIQTEARVFENIGVRIAGARVLGYERSNEFGIGGIGLITYYLPLKSRIIEPLIGFGVVYSLYHWDMDFDKGNLHDLNIGGGIGINIKFCNKFRSGINVFALNNFEADYSYEGERMEIIGRKLLILPTLTLDYLF